MKRAERVLRLTVPFMEGEDVKAVQRVLGLLDDGEYGPATGSEVAAWKYRMGAEREAVNTGLGIEAQRVMFRRPGEKLPAEWAARRLARMAIGFKPGWGIAKPIPFDPADAMLTMRYWAAGGLVEQPAGSNIVPALQTIGRKHGARAAAMGYPWCAYAAFLAALPHGGKSATAGLVEQRFNALYTPEILVKAQNAEHGLRIVGLSQVRPGDLALFNFTGGDPRVDHIGRVVTPPGNSGLFESVEGNTSSDNGGSQSNGGGVYVRTRPVSIVRAFARDS